MKRKSSGVIVALSLTLVGGVAAAQEAKPDPKASPEAARIEAVLKSIDWQKGPTKVKVGDQGEMQIPDGHLFTGGPGTRKMLELMKNPTDGRELGLLTTTRLEWFLIFEFRDIGYVKDADKEKLEGDKILDSIRKGTEQSNEERKRRGWPPISILGWHTAPFYDPATKNLHWCIKGQSEGRLIVNFNTRVLGRQGVMSANLLVSPAKLDTVVPQVKQMLSTSFSFQQGKRYAEYKKGDRIAEYGLAALVVGGAAGVAAKLGLFGKLFGFLGKLWKLLIVGILALGAGIKALFFGKKAQPPPSSNA